MYMCVYIYIYYIFKQGSIATAFPIWALGFNFPSTRSGARLLHTSLHVTHPIGCQSKFSGFCYTKLLWIEVRKLSLISYFKSIGTISLCHHERLWRPSSMAQTLPHIISSLPSYIPNININNYPPNKTHNKNNNESEPTCSFCRWNASSFGPRRGRCHADDVPCGARGRSAADGRRWWHPSSGSWILSALARPCWSPQNVPRPWRRFMGVLKSGPIWLKMVKFWGRFESFWILASMCAGLNLEAWVKCRKTAMIHHFDRENDGKRTDWEGGSPERGSYPQSVGFRSLKRT